ncbi:uncharacterized protein LOC135829644 [Sycon ciliatum]|uniref:uncharacterized protein LOC135829644 n=1 Tax=Sycon ciliatum TaxID=27933 RepID=UPI0031F717E1
MIFLLRAVVFSLCSCEALLLLSSATNTAMTTCGSTTDHIDEDTFGSSAPHNRAQSTQAPAITYVTPSLATPLSKTLSIFCTATGNPIPEIHFATRCHGNISMSNLPYGFQMEINYTCSSRDLASTTSKLTIDSSTAADSGTYLCVARSDSGLVTKSIDVALYVPPEVFLVECGAIGHFSAADVPCTVDGRCENETSFSPGHCVHRCFQSTRRPGAVISHGCCACVPAINTTLPANTSQTVMECGSVCRGYEHAAEKVYCGNASVSPRYQFTTGPLLTVHMSVSPVEALYRPGSAINISCQASIDAPGLTLAILTAKNYRTDAVRLNRTLIVLQVHSAEAGDGGLYRCEARRTLAEASYHYSKVTEEQETSIHVAILLHSDMWLDHTSSQAVLGVLAVLCLLIIVGAIITISMYKRQSSRRKPLSRWRRRRRRRRDQARPDDSQPESGSRVSQPSSMFLNSTPHRPSSLRKSQFLSGFPASRPESVDIALSTVMENPNADDMPPEVAERPCLDEQQLQETTQNFQLQDNKSLLYRSMYKQSTRASTTSSANFQRGAHQNLKTGSGNKRMLSGLMQSQSVRTLDNAQFQVQLPRQSQGMSFDMRRDVHRETSPLARMSTDGERRPSGASNRTKSLASLCASDNSSSSDSDASRQESDSSTTVQDKEKENDSPSTVDDEEKERDSTTTVHYDRKELQLPPSPRFSTLLGPTPDLTGTRTRRNTPVKRARSVSFIGTSSSNGDRNAQHRKPIPFTAGPRTPGSLTPNLTHMLLSDSPQVLPTNEQVNTPRTPRLDPGFGKSRESGSIRASLAPQGERTLSRSCPTSPQTRTR